MLAIASVLGVKAQYTLTASSNPVVGDIYQYYYMDTTGVTFGSTGTAQVWDYTNLVVSYPPLVTETYTTVASTPNASLFPAANIASETNAGYFEYYNMSATERSLIGWTNSVTQSVNANPVVFSVLPFSYGSSAVSNNFTTTSMSSLGPNSNYSGVMTITAEGTGTLILPDGTAYANVLKIKTVKTDTLIGYNGFSMKVSCKWYSAVSKFPLLEVSVTILHDGGSGPPFVNKVIRMNNIRDVGLYEPADTKTEFSIYPNPSQTQVFVDFETSPEKSYSIDIIDIQGSIVKRETFRSVKSGMQHNRIDLSVLSAGTYFVKLRSEGKEGMRQLVIE